MAILKVVEVLTLAAFYLFLFAGFQFFMAPMRIAHDDDARDRAMVTRIHNPFIIAVNS
jgi:hypothetical protein